MVIPLRENPPQGESREVAELLLNLEGGRAEEAPQEGHRTPEGSAETSGVH
jgi:hypothetical protein